MTKPTSDELRDEIATVGRALNQAFADVALYDRLKKAASEVVRLQKRATELTSMLNDAQSAEERAEVAAFEATFKNLKIRRQPGGGNIMNDAFVISYERLRFCMDAHESVWKNIDVPGFEHLDGPMLNHIMTHRPELIDAQIKALVPHDLYLAMSKFVNAKQRGYLIS